MKLDQDTFEKELKEIKNGSNIVEMLVNETLADFDVKECKVFDSFKS